MLPIGDRIRNVRKLYKYTQQDLAKMLGVTRTHVGRIETGKAKASTQLIKLISEKLDVTEHWLLHGEEGDQEKNPIRKELLTLEEYAITWYVDMFETLEKTTITSLNICEGLIPEKHKGKFDLSPDNPVVKRFKAKVENIKKNLEKLEQYVEFFESKIP